MSGFWKATRPDGTDFYSGTVDYAAALASGEPLPELAGGDFPGEGWYHVGVAPTSCVGMSWPCRLFRVEPVGAVEHVGFEKAGCRSLRVVEERPGHEALGPHGVHVAALVERARALTPDEAKRLDAAGYAAGAAAWYAARDAAGYAARAAAGYAAWAAAGDAAWDAAWAAAWYAARDAAWAAAWDAARDAARDAALALVVRDLIRPEHYATLTGLWASVIGPVHPDDEPPNEGAGGTS